MKNRIKMISVVTMLMIFIVGTFAFLNEAKSEKPYYKFVTISVNNKAKISSQAQYEKVLIKMHKEGYIYSHTASIVSSPNAWPDIFIVFVAQ